MSWKLFLQIVLLLIIGGLVLASLKISLLNYKYDSKAKYMQTKKPHGRMQTSPQKGPRK